MRSLVRPEDICGTDPAQKTNWYKEVLRVSLPLAVSMASTMVMEITDRIFLANYSLDAIAAATPGGIVAFLFISLFIGVAGYANVFIAQYTGAGIKDRIGVTLWQGIYFSLASGLIMASLWWTAPAIFRISGHAPEVQVLEVIYFRILCAGSGIHILSIALSCFFMGRGLNRPVMLVNIAGMLLNIPLNYLLINGLLGFPEMGIAGAGIGTVCAWTLMAVLYWVLIFNRKNEKEFGIWKNRQFDRQMFARMMRFGIPGASQFTLDIMAFTFFILMVGRLGKAELAVTNIVLSINSLAFMPMMGFAMGTSTLVGNALGRNRPEDAIAATRSTLHLVYAYISLLGLIFLSVPELLIGVFHAGNRNPEEYAAIRDMGVILLRFVTAYIFFDAQYTIYSGTLKGAGDTRFIMWVVVLFSIVFMIIPLYFGIEYFGGGVYYAWTCTTLYIFSLFAISFGRYVQGKWKGMRVIEERTFAGKNGTPATSTIG